MKLVRLFAAITVFSIIGMTCGCNSSDTQAVQIAVIGCEETYEDGYLNGIKLAVKDACELYSNYNIEAVYYEDNENYETGAAIVDEIVSDDKVTAVIGSQTPSICESAAYSLENAGIPMIAPYTVYDSMMTEKNYRQVFAMCYSQELVGKMLYRAMNEEFSGEKIIALCYCEDQSCKDEARGFAEECIGEIADYVKLDDVAVRFDEIYNRWAALGVNIVVIMPYDTEGFDVLEEIKSRNPAMNVIGDFMFDNSDEIERVGTAFEGFMYVNPFYTETDYGDTGARYEAEYGEKMGKWAMHGYDAVMIIVNAAVKSDDIADYLHQNPYSTYSFDKNGRLLENNITYEICTGGEIQRKYIISEE